MIDENGYPVRDSDAEESPEEKSPELDSSEDGEEVAPWGEEWPPHDLTESSQPQGPPLASSLLRPDFSALPWPGPVSMPNPGSEVSACYSDQAVCVPPVAPKNEPAVMAVPVPAAPGAGQPISAPVPINPFAQPQTKQVATHNQPPPNPFGRKKDENELELMIEIGENYYYYLDNDRTEYVDIPALPYVLPVTSEAFLGHLVGEYYNTHHCVAKKSHTSIVRHFTNKSRLNPNVEIVHNRFAYRGEGKSLTLCIDLANANGDAVIITSNGWHVTNKHGFKFKRFSHMRPLPAPIKNGNLLSLFDLVNLHREQDKVLLVPWLVVAPNNTIPRPLVTLHGLQGSAKSMTALMLRNVIDPISTGGIYVHNAANELAQNLYHHAVPLFDNITVLSQNSCDMLCIGCTGGGISKRALYTNEEDFMMHFKRPIIITGITVPYSAQDLLDRSFVIEMSHIDERRRKYEADLWAEYNANQASYLGGLLDLLAGAMARLSTIQIDSKPRLADFCRWGAAVAEELGPAKGFGKDRFVAAMFGASTAAYDESLSGDPLADVLLDALRVHGELELAVSDLHTGLKGHAVQIGVGSDKLPGSPSALSKKLKGYVKLLETKGWQVVFSDRAREHRTVTFKHIVPKAKTLVP